MVRGPPRATRTDTLFPDRSRFRSRLTEREIERLSGRGEVELRHVRLRDRFGDNGLIAVVVLRQDCDRLHVDTWVMSCRVLGRTVEEFTANAIRRVALRRGCRTIVGADRPSPKNGMVAEPYDLLGLESDRKSPPLNSRPLFASRIRSS